MLKPLCVATTCDYSYKIYTTNVPVVAYMYVIYG